MKKISLLFSIIFLFHFNCTQRVYLEGQNRIKDGLYDSEFPSVPTSQFIKEINETVKQVNVMAQYVRYEFSRDDEVTRENIIDNLFTDLVIDENNVTYPATGTATVIQNNSKQMALLTCAHIVDSPDTILTFYTDINDVKTPYLYRVQIKKYHSINVSYISGPSEFNIIAKDVKTDIAIIGRTYLQLENKIFKSFRYPKGKAAELDPGTFVYIFGFPRGVKMVTTSIVGQVKKSLNNRFILNAPLTNGISGGLVVAIRDGVPNFEMVGMVFSIAGDTYTYLGPDPDSDLDAYDDQQEYLGDVYLNRSRQIVYGITYAISMEDIEDFLEENREEISSYGYDIETFFQ